MNLVGNKVKTLSHQILTNYKNNIIEPTIPIGEVGIVTTRAFDYLLCVWVQFEWGGGGWYYENDLELITE